MKEISISMSDRVCVEMCIKDNNLSFLFLKYLKYCL